MFIHRILTVSIFCFVWVGSYQIADISDCLSIEHINCGRPENILQLKHCTCSCAVPRLVNHQHLEIDYSQCNVFMQCKWGNAMQFTIDVKTSKEEVIFSKHIKVGSENPFRVSKVELNLHHRDSYIIEILTECEICDSSCKVIKVDVPVTYFTDSTPPSSSIDNIMIPLYAVVVPSVISACVILSVLLYRKWRKSSRNHEYNMHGMMSVETCVL